MTAQGRAMTKTDNQLSPPTRLHTVRSLSNFFGVSERTIRRWCADKLIVGRYKYQGGTCLKLFFTEGAVLRFMDENMPTMEDLDLNRGPQTGEQKVEMIRRIRNMHRIFAGRALATKMARQLAKVEGIDESEVRADEQDFLAKAEEAVNLRHGLGRRESNYPDRPSSSDRGNEGWQDSWNDEMDPKR